MNKTPDPVLEMGVEYLKLALIVSLTLSTIAVGGAYALKILTPVVFAGVATPYVAPPLTNDTSQEGEV
jgi:hypothetical protein